MPSSDTPPSVASSNDDESARIDIAVRALDDMRSRASGSASSGEGRASPHNSKGNDQDDVQQQSQAPSDRGFMTRMTSLPLVNTAIRVYEQGKASSTLVKYGAQMVESSVKTISKPVINRLPVDQIDDFACRQFDRFDKYRRPSVGPESPRPPVSPSRDPPVMDSRMSDLSDAGPSSSSFSIKNEVDRGRPKLRTKTLDGSPDPKGKHPQQHSRGGQEDGTERRTYVGNDRSVPEWIEATHSYSRTSGNGVGSPVGDSRIGSPIILEGRRTRSPEHHSPDRQTAHLRRYSNNDRETPTSGQSLHQNQNSERQVAQRSRWQAMLLEAGGLGVALSDENMRRLKYCLNWLLYATAHIDAQILILRDFIESIQPMPHTTSTSRRPPISEEQLRKLTEVRKDIVSTIRQMVDVVSKYAGGALPEPARGRVRGFILKLPQRWASRTAAAGVTGGAVPASTASGSGERERETVAAAGSSTGILRRGQGRDKRAAQRERGTGSRAPSPSAPDPHISHPSQNGPSSTQQLSHSNASAAAQRILTLATESLDMMRNVTGVVKDSLDRADAWVNRLRTVGVQRAGQEAGNEPPNEELGLPRLGSQYDAVSISRDDYRALFLTHRRGTSSSSITGEDDTSFSGSTPASPFTTTTSLSHGSGLLSNSTSFTAGSSMPSTPTGTSLTASASSMRDVYGENIANAPSPGAIPLGSMHIASRFNTPKMTAVGLPNEIDSIDGRGSEREPESLRRSSLARMEVDS